MNTTGNIDGAFRRGKDIYITLKVNTNEESVKELREHDLLDIKIEKHREKRSRNANSYMWELIGQISGRIGIPPTEIYKQCLKDAGQCTYIAVSDEAVDFSLRALTDTKSTGTGNFAEVQFGGHDKEKKMTTLVVYIGSSHYNTAEMSKLIDYVVEIAKEYGIDTLTPDEIERMKNAQQ